MHGRALLEKTYNSLSYKPQHQMRLRNLLFNNPHILTVAAEVRQEEERWLTWLSRMKETAGGLENGDFGYLRDHFTSFQDLAAVIAFFQSSAIEGNSNKRWSSKFVFPFGGHALYEDVNVSASNGVTNDRRFFGRTGEILYLMLCRSSRASDVSRLVSERLLGGEGPYDRLVHILQGGSEHARLERGGSYLPLAACGVRSSRGGLVRLLTCRVPAFDIIPHLVAITGLNLILYQLERAQEVVPKADTTRLVCEIIGPKRSKVRELSEKSYQANQGRPGQAIENYIRSLADSEAWRKAVASDHPRVNAAALLSERFDFDEEDLDDIKGGRRSSWMRWFRGHRSGTGNMWGGSMGPGRALLVCLRGAQAAVRGTHRPTGFSRRSWFAGRTAD